MALQVNYEIGKEYGNTKVEGSYFFITHITFDTMQDKDVEVHYCVASSKENREKGIFYKRDLIGIPLEEWNDVKLDYDEMHCFAYTWLKNKESFVGAKDI